MWPRSLSYFLFPGGRFGIPHYHDPNGRRGADSNRYGRCWATNRRTIMAKYLIYCGAATVLGCAVGLASGFQLLPTVLYKAYASQYELPELILQFNGKFALISCGLEILCTLGATWFACSRTLSEKPAALMVPRAPKAGKRILLERATASWKPAFFQLQSHCTKYLPL